MKSFILCLLSYLTYSQHNQPEMRIKESRVRIKSPPSTATTLSKATSTSHCSKCSHCHPRSDSSIFSSTSRSTDKQVERVPKSILRSSDYAPQDQLAPIPMPHPHPHPLHLSQQQSMPFQPNHRQMQMQMPIPMPMPMMPMAMHEPRLHPFAPAPVLHNLGRGPEPLFGWESVMPLNHAYGQPKYIKRVKPDYRRFCFSVGKADVPFAAMPGGPLWGMDVTMAPQMVGGHRW
jgi:hypothetical protein